MIVPYGARKTVDLAPALVLGASSSSARVRLIGLALADPIVARSRRRWNRSRRTTRPRAPARPADPLAALGSALGRAVQSGGPASGGPSGRRARRRRAAHRRPHQLPASRHPAAICKHLDPKTSVSWAVKGALAGSGH